MRADETPERLLRDRWGRAGLSWPVLVSCLAVAAVTVGCGDGVGRPLRAEQRGALSGAGGSSGSPQGGTQSVGGKVDVPLTLHCAAAEAWSADFARSEETLLSILNTARAVGVSCETGESDDDLMTPGLMMQQELRCSARLHARDMVERAFYGRVNPDEDTPEQRMRRAGGEFEEYSEILVASEPGVPAEQAAYAAFIEILSEEGKCENALDARFTNVGIGYFEEKWTLDLSGP